MQGYDVDLFARRGLAATGLDVAATGVASANTWLASRAEGRGKDASVVQGDFFTHAKEGGYDLIYDYT
jgi:hypothetical protein